MKGAKDESRMMEYIEILSPLARELISWATFLSLLYLALKFSLWVAGSMASMHTREGSPAKAKPPATFTHETEAEET